MNAAEEQRRSHGYRLVLIDYENVQPNLLPLLDHKQMRVIVFVGACQKSVPFEFAAAMQRLGRRATYVKLSGNGSNALDFHIAFYLGVLAVRDSAAYFHIISKDTGYDPLIQHLRARDIKAHRFEDVRDIPTIKKDLSSPLPPARHLCRSPNRTSILPPPERRKLAWRACDQWRRPAPQWRPCCGDAEWHCCEGGEWQWRACIVWHYRHARNRW